MNHQQSYETILNFMGQLNYRYDSADVHHIWDALKAMSDKWGDIYVAEAIQKDSKDAELALFRYWKRYLAQPEEPEADHTPIRFRKVYPKQKNIVKRFLKLFVAAVIALVAFTLLLSASMNRQSDRLLDEVDRFIEMQEGRDKDGLR